jgi:hypothetical protein
LPTCADEGSNKSIGFIALLGSATDRKAIGRNVHPVDGYLLGANSWKRERQQLIMDHWMGTSVPYCDIDSIYDHQADTRLYAGSATPDTQTLR